MVKPKAVVAVLLYVSILVVGYLCVVNIYKDHQVNQKIIDECYENFEENEVGVTLTKVGDTWSCTKK